MCFHPQSRKPSIPGMTTRWRKGTRERHRNRRAGGCLPHSEQFSLASGNNEMGRLRALGQHPATVFIMDIHRGEFCLHQGDHVRELLKAWAQASWRLGRKSSFPSLFYHFSSPTVSLGHRERMPDNVLVFQGSTQSLSCWCWLPD